MNYIFVDYWGPDLPNNICGYKIPSWQREPDGLHYGNKVCVTPKASPHCRCREHELMKLERKWDILLQGWSSLSDFDVPTQ
jgi:hypothetical protein